MNGRMERELPYTDFDIALLNAMKIATKPKSRAMKILDAACVAMLSGLVTYGLVSAYIWTVRWFQ